MTPLRIVVIGGGMAAARLAERLGGRSDVSLTILGEERHVPYNRALLIAALCQPSLLSSLALHTQRWFDSRNINLQLAVRAVSIDRRRQNVVLHNGMQVPYDALVLATGAIPVVPLISGARGCRDYRIGTIWRIRDVQRLRAMVRHARRIAVIGGGALGVEVAAALAGRCGQVTLTHDAPQLLNSLANAAVSAATAEQLRRHGVEIHLGRPVREIRRRANELTLIVSGGTAIDVDGVVLAAGARPATRLAAAAKLEVDEAGVVVTDTFASPDDPNIFAIGDCAATGSRGQALAAWRHADALAEVFGAAPGGRTYVPVATLRVRAPGVDLLAVGRWQAGASVLLDDAARRTYAHLTVEEGRLVGGILFGDTRRAGRLLHAASRPWSAVSVSSLLFESTVRMPAPRDDDLACVCRGVPVGEVRRLIRAGCAVDEICRQTGAASGCGSCRTLLQALIDEGAADAEPACHGVDAAQAHR
ncbi:FAD-dependent pyridine nucleotide-disulfide oxidoreductase [Acidothermus cellulolyticus 11B]|uniref:FAD-dependent pyridine nucleotide-disulfide oxidoreductase n=1 Tax=Acidothermus cellulolyticus (strain ATCC 43068 / DSM 8971 / 11B) TaxID=351607 RepID=A0LVQ7_ACIC1|nr:FAD-dependent oxidoreductase [Acidothermus cellulolyticus]ABK53517.1 FAD-dependent pyridine nucleotide-disulfide oxidoreductase [Acidothermus cellulolyticus 11B]